jgi:pSer/pThr/pTyr-binding forkhead associated (FHA) protein
MSNRLSEGFGLVEGHTYIIGREGGVYIEDHIYINSPSVSRRHAAMKIKNGRIYLCDLDSTNGTYLMENDSLVPFKEGYVSPSQPIAIGHVKCTINSLLAIAGVYSASKNTTSNSEDTQLMPSNQ